MPRTTLLLLGLVASVATAQTPADSVVVVRDSTVSVESAGLHRGEVRVVTRLRVDSVLVRSRTRSSARPVRLALPTEGGVFYYRAGAGSALQRVRRTLPDEALRRVDRQREGLEPLASERTEGRMERGEERSEQAVPSGVTQRDLDQLERRLMSELDRRVAEEARAREPRDRRPDPVPIGVPPARAGDEPSVDRPVEAPRPEVTEVPGSPGDSLRPVPVSPLAEMPDEPEVTVEEVERAILDTGVFRTSRVFFAFGEAELLPASRRALDTVSEVLLRYPELRVEVGGHTDSVSSDAFNLELSQRRAGSVASYLIVQGIAADRITAVGYGEARPMVSNETEAGRAFNRRVEFVVQE